MINRTIKNQIISSINNWPITFIIGARQVGKTTLCKEIADEFGYKFISLDDIENKDNSNKDPKGFINELGNNKLVIDEIQYSKRLFEVLTSIVNKTKLEKGDNAANGMFIITGSQSFHLMKNVRESMAGRVNIINMSCLSMNEIYNQQEIPFEVNNDQLIENQNTHQLLDKKEVEKMMIRGFYPKLINDKNFDNFSFYKNYINTYIDRDVRELINIKDYSAFSKFITLLATYNGQELVKENLSKVIGVDSKTITSWISVLEASMLITLVQPYYENSFTKRIVKKNKLYFNDTGLLCFLLEIKNNSDFNKSKYNGAIFETYIFNEIKKSYLNNNLDPKIFFYRDKDQKEIDFIIKKDGKLNLVEVKLGEKYSLSDVKSFSVLNNSSHQINGSCIICNTKNSYVLKYGLLVYPYNVI